MRIKGFVHPATWILRPDEKEDIREHGCLSHRQMRDVERSVARHVESHGHGIPFTFEHVGWEKTMEASTKDMGESASFREHHDKMRGSDMRRAATEARKSREHSSRPIIIGACDRIYTSALTDRKQGWIADLTVDSEWEKLVTMWVTDGTFAGLSLTAIPDAHGTSRMCPVEVTWTSDPLFKNCWIDGSPQSYNWCADRIEKSESREARNADMEAEQQAEQQAAQTAPAAESAPAQVDAPQQEVSKLEQAIREISETSPENADVIAKTIEMISTKHSQLSKEKENVEKEYSALREEQKKMEYKLKNHSDAMSDLVINLLKNSDVLGMKSQITPAVEEEYKNAAREYPMFMNHMKEIAVTANNALTSQRTQRKRPGDFSTESITKSMRMFDDQASSSTTTGQKQTEQAPPNPFYAALQASLQKMGCTDLNYQ